MSRTVPVPQEPAVALVVASLASGGAERVVATMANHWAATGRPVTVVTVDGMHADFYPLAPAVARRALDLLAPSANPLHAIALNLRRIRQLRRALVASGARTVVSFVERTNVIVRLATAGLPLRIVLAERTDPRAHRIGPVWDGLRRLTYRAADAVAVQTPSVRDWAVGWLPGHRVHVIPNPVDRARWRPPTPPAPRQSVILGIGRFTVEKGFDVLVRAFALLAPRFPEWTLELLGDGPLREELESLTRSLGIGERVVFRGTVGDPERYLHRSAIFALPSRFEGFPNALLEAMASGCAVVATDCPSGPRHIIRDARNGLLVDPDDPAALAAGIARLMDDASLRGALAQEAQLVVEEYDVDRIMALWERVIDGAGK